MKKMICECCGGSDIIKISNELYQCESCGVKYKSENIADLLRDVMEETVIKNSPKTDDMLITAFRAIQNNDWERAYSIAGDVLRIDSENPEALYYTGVALGRANAGKSYTTPSYAKTVEKDALREKTASECVLLLYNFSKKVYFATGPFFIQAALAGWYVIKRERA